MKEIDVIESLMIDRSLFEMCEYLLKNDKLEIGERINVIIDESNKLPSKGFDFEIIQTTAILQSKLKYLKP